MDPVLTAILDTDCRHHDPNLPTSTMLAGKNDFVQKKKKKIKLNKIVSRF